MGIHSNTPFTHSPYACLFHSDGQTFNKVISHIQFANSVPGTLPANCTGLNWFHKVPGNNRNHMHCFLCSAMLTSTYQHIPLGWHFLLPSLPVKYIDIFPCLCVGAHYCTLHIYQHKKEFGNTLHI